MNNEHIKALLQGIAPVIKQAIEDAQRPLLDRIDALEKRAPEKGDKGDSVTVADVLPVIDAVVAKAVGDLPKAEPGKDADPEVTARLVAEEVQRAVASLPAPADGKSVTAEDVRPMLAEMVAALPKAEPGKDGVGLAGAVIDREGGLVVTLTDGSQRELGRVVGRDAEPGKPGLDGLGFDDIAVEYDGARTFKIAFVRGEERKECGEFVIPSMIYRGVWREGEFKAGDVVTFGGSLFVARKDTTTKPETQSTDWTLSAKRGKDGQNQKPVDVASIERRAIDVTKKYIDDRFEKLGAFPRHGG